jgi:hypothetical protein
MNTDNAVKKLTAMGYEIHPVVNLWARKCDITGEGMNSGYCIDDGRMYIKHEYHMIMHLRRMHEDGKEDRLTDKALLEYYYESEYYYYTDWECNTDIQYAEVDGKMYEEGEPEFEMAITPYSKDKRKVTQNFDTLKQDIKNLFKAMDENTTTLWRDDLESTHECVVLEDVEDGVKMDECDNPTMACKGSDVVNMIQYIKAVYLK